MVVILKFLNLVYSMKKNKYCRFVDKIYCGFNLYDDKVLIISNVS